MPCAGIVEHEEHDMPYRSPASDAQRGNLVTVRRYFSPLDAEMDRARLRAEGIPAHVIEGASFNPLVNGIGSGVQLQVGDRDRDRADTILGELAIESGDDGEAPGTVRCPRCELAYCSFERPRLRTNAPAPWLSPIVLVLSLFRALGPKRWQCERCEHVWDDPKEGPIEMTKTEPGDPRPVFRLRRAHAGMGLFLGGLIGFFAGAVIGHELGLLVALALTGGGYFIGSRLRYDLCSEPQCRTPLRSGVEDCPRCKGAVAGVIHAAAAHYAAVADFRRELAAMRKKLPEDSVKKRKKSRSVAKELRGASNA
ncbi:Hypothetical protein A7982_09969 [Minicystis rosea]|nr:Hypothetical protein A7982_09969 [Minicystis rosea]